MFDDIEPSTRTIINVMNINIDIKKLFNELETVPYIFPSSKRGRRKKEDLKKIENNVPDGSIINIRYENLEKGVFKKKKTSTKFFRNAMTITMINKKKPFSFKIFTSKEGGGTKTQHPGCKLDEMVVHSIKHLFMIIKDKPVYHFIRPSDDKLTLLLHVTMTNINFNLGFNVSRQNLNKYISDFSKYNSMLETNIGHAGTNITRKISEQINMGEITKVTINEKFETHYEYVSFQEYLDNLTSKQITIFNNKIRKNTFLVFYSGKTIMSGFDLKHMKGPYEDFIKDIYSIRHKIEDKHVT